MWRTGLLALLALAALPRVLALGDDFWLDEVWSLLFAGLVEAPLDVVLSPQLKHDNNHLLNTLYMWLLGGEAAPWLYRLPALLAGIGTVWLAMAAGRSRGLLERVIAGLLFAGSLLMIAYSTEARGYAPAVFCAMLALLAFERLSERVTLGRLLAFWGAVVVGCAFHFTTLHFYAGVLLWSAWRLPFGRRGWRRELGASLAIHAVPLACIGVLYVFFLRGLTVGGGPSLPPLEVLTMALAWMLGGPVHPATGVAAGLLVAVVLAANAWMSRHDGSQRWVFDLGVVLLAPLFTLLVLEPDYLAARYFLVSIAFFLLVLARVLARLWMVGTSGRVAVVLVLLAYAAGNAAEAAPFVRVGKGGYAAALQHMGEYSAGRAITVRCVPDIGDPMLLEYHARGLAKPLRFFHAGSAPAGGVEWLIRSSKLHDPGFEPEFVVRGRGARRVYRVELRLPYAGPSGFTWWVYRRVG